MDCINSSPSAAKKSCKRMGWKRRQRKPAIEGDTSSLPCEVIHNILLKLPVKSLLRFRAVSKAWCAVISELQFVKSHLDESIKSDRQRLFCSDPSSSSFYSIGYESCDESEEKLCFPCKKYREAIVWCSCNGLVLLALNDDRMCVLWNPSIRACKKFSCPPIYCNYVPYGLCYDSSMDDYKVVFISERHHEIFFVVFSFRGQCWTEASKFPYLGFYGDMVVVNGVLHSVAFTPLITRRNSNSHPPTRYLSSSDDGGDGVHEYEYDSSNRYVIVYYDMVDDKFKEMAQPKCMNGGDIFSLAVMRGWLSLYCNTIDEKNVVVWTMKKYGEKNSWSKLFVIPRSVGITMHLASLTPLCATKKGEVVMIMDGKRMMIYDPKENKHRWVGLTNIQNSSVVLCVDSFVLPIRTPQVRGKRKNEL